MFVFCHSLSTCSSECMFPWPLQEFDELLMRVYGVLRTTCCFKAHICGYCNFNIYTTVQLS